MNTYQFKERLEVGAKGERRLDQHFKERYEVLNVPMALQRIGIDRVFVSRTDGDVFTVEYKTDSYATGNAFVETVSVDKDGKAGWAHTSKAEILVYYAAAFGQAYVIDMLDIRAALPDWQRRYRETSVGNDTYVTKGLLVPLRELSELSAYIADIPTK